MNDQNPPQGPPNSSGSAGFEGNSRPCPNCGRLVMPRDSHCPNCGARLSSSSPGTLSTVGMGCLGFLALGLGGFGTCSLIFSVPSLFSRRSDGEMDSLLWIFLVLGAGASYLAILCVRRIIEAIRARRDKP